MRSSPPITPRLIVMVLLAIAILIALIVATGGGFSTSVSPTSTPSAAPPPTQAASSQVRGSVSVAVKHLGGHTWRYTYRIKNLGKQPIGGFQINGPRSNLFAITHRPGWAVYGEGVCGGNNPGVLIYWTSTPAGPSVIRPGQAMSFGFKVNTSGSMKRDYSLSWASAAPVFGKTSGPAASRLPASGPCK